MPLPLLALAGIGAGANVLGGLLGEWWGSADDEQRRALEDQALQQYGDISAPTLERVLASQVERSAFEGMPTDFGNRNARNAALQALVNEGLSGGNSLESRLAMEETRRASSAQELRDRQAVLQQAKARGLGSNAALAGQLQAQQASADRQSYAGLQAGASARQRALAALAQGGSMAAQAEGQDFDRAARVAESRDRIAQFNAGQAQQANLYNAGLAQQNFNNRLAVADRKAGGLQRRADTYASDADRKRRMLGGIGQSVGYGLAAYGANGGGKP